MSEEKNIRFAEAKIELYELIENISNLAENNLNKSDIKEFEALIAMMSNTINSAKSVVEFLKVIFGFSGSSIDEVDGTMQVSSSEVYSRNNVDEALGDSGSDVSKESIGSINFVETPRNVSKRMKCRKNKGLSSCSSFEDSMSDSMASEVSLDPLGISRVSQEEVTTEICQNGTWSGWQGDDQACVPDLRNQDESRILGGSSMYEGDAYDTSLASHSLNNGVLELSKAIDAIKDDESHVDLNDVVSCREAEVINSTKLETPKIHSGDGKHRRVVDIGTVSSSQFLSEPISPIPNAIDKVSTLDISPPSIPTLTPNLYISPPSDEKISPPILIRESFQFREYRDSKEIDDDSVVDSLIAPLIGEVNSDILQSQDIDQHVIVPIEQKKAKSANRSVSFQPNCPVFLFPRAQGWLCVPKEGGCTLGMAGVHQYMEEVPLRDVEQDRVYADSCSKESSPPLASSQETSPVELFPQENNKKDRRRSCRRSTIISSMSTTSLLKPRKGNKMTKSTATSDLAIKLEDLPEDDLENNIDLGKTANNEWKSTMKEPGVIKLTRVGESLPIFPTAASPDVSVVTNSSLDQSGEVNSGGKGELGTRGLARIKPKQRRQMLKACGVELDMNEGRQLAQLREWRKSVGCDCVGGCSRERGCVCAIAGVGCHEENYREPCNCSDQNCCNPDGRYKFDPTKVKFHFIQTIMDTKGGFAIN